MYFSLLEIGLIICLLLSCAAIIIAVRGLSTVRKQVQENEKLYQRLVRDISAANSGSIGIGQRLLAMEKRLQNEEQKQQPVDLKSDDEFQAYADAAQLFKMGFSSEEVASRCGLSRAEASLMEMMQKAGK